MARGEDNFGMRKVAFGYTEESAGERGELPKSKKNG